MKKLSHIINSTQNATTLNYDVYVYDENNIILGAFVIVIFINILRFYFKTCFEQYKCENIPLLKSTTGCYFFATFTLLTSFFLLPFVALVIIIFTINRSIVNEILKRKYGIKYGGLLDGSDVIWTVEDRSKSIINVLISAEQSDNIEDCEKFFESLKKLIIDEINYGTLSDSKLTSTFHNEFGYSFILKDSVRPLEYIKQFDTENPKDDLMTLKELREKCSQFSNSPLPKNHTVFTEVLVGKKPVIWKENDRKKCCVCIFRFHHALADGVILMETVAKFLKNPYILKNNPATKLKIFQNEDMLWKKIIIFIYKIIWFLLCFAFMPTMLFLEIFLRSDNKNSLHGPELSGKKELFWKTEEDKEFVEVVKKLRRKIPHTLFVDIMFTAFMESFYEYYKKKNEPIPKFITALVALKLNFDEMLGYHREEEFKLTNNFTFALLNMPIDNSEFCGKNTKTKMLSRLNENKKITEALKNSMQFHFALWAIKIINSIFPTPLIDRMYKFKKYTMAISNLPGPDGFSIFNDMLLRDAIFWPPHRGYLGVSLSCLSYDNRFQLGLNIDKCLISNNDDAQQILENVFKCLRKLENEEANSY